MKPLSRAALASRGLRPPAQPWLRYYTSEPGLESQWFQELRAEMLGRKFPVSLGRGPYSIDFLRNTLDEALPPNGLEDTALLAARLQTRFNPDGPVKDLLPDGTDTLHSPGGDFVRRMWTGGSLKLHSSDPQSLNSFRRMMCYERIKDVQLRGEGAAAKIFVSIERRFRHGSNRDIAVPEALQQADHTSPEWSDPIAVEERNLVFLKPKTAEELAEFGRGSFTDPRYARSLGVPEFAHKFTPSSPFLFRWSALTWNAHAIHLDPTYARLVEGHRDLLVHGPLTIVLMLGFLTSYIRKLPTPLAISSIEYRNLAPLYVDEELQLCGRLGANGYHVWIQGPTGGMAVKATVRTVPLPIVNTPAVPEKPSRNVPFLEDDTTAEPGTTGPTTIIPTRTEKRRLRAQSRGIQLPPRKVMAAPSPMKTVMSPLQQQLARKLLPNVPRNPPREELVYESPVRTYLTDKDHGEWKNGVKPPRVRMVETLRIRPVEVEGYRRRPGRRARKLMQMQRKEEALREGQEVPGSD